jgi:hypothetical protein
MKTVVVTLLTLVLLSGASEAEQKPIAEYSWQSLSETGKIQSGAVVTLPDKTVALKIENTTGQPLNATVLTIEQPKIKTDFYHVRGEVKHEGIEGDGYLEMWNHFGESSYFSRTLGHSGPMGKLSGTSDWRGFLLPFNATGTKSPPTKLVINVYLPAKGVVFLKSPLILAESSTPPGASVHPGAWWSDRTGNLAGGILGAVIGCTGGLIGWLSSRGRAQGFVINAARILTGIGILSAIGGLVAVSIRQPYGVWYPLLLLGVICALVFPVCLRTCVKRYRELELRRMTSMDASR